VTSPTESRRTSATPRRTDRGQASIELVAMVPVVLIAGAVVWQLALAGQTAWLTANAARVAARADAVGHGTTEAARSALPRSLEDGLEVERLRRGGARVSVKVPLLLTPWKSPLRVTAEASLGSGP
jgi:hypothetical protein